MLTYDTVTLFRLLSQTAMLIAFHAGNRRSFAVLLTALRLRLLSTLPLLELDDDTLMSLTSDTLLHNFLTTCDPRFPTIRRDRTKCVCEIHVKSGLYREILRVRGMSRERGMVCGFDVVYCRLMDEMMYKEYTKKPKQYRTDFLRISYQLEHVFTKLPCGF